jgi:hypothetical protein
MTIVLAACPLQQGVELYWGQTPEPDGVHEESLLHLRMSPGNRCQVMIEEQKANNVGSIKLWPGEMANQSY